MNKIPTYHRGQRNYGTGYDMMDRIDRLEAGLRECAAEIDQYIWQEHPGDHPVHERYRRRDLSANPARAALEDKP